MFSIGECSRITGVSVKALRLYHEKGLLVPHTIDKVSGYRYYSSEDITKAQLIRRLRDMELSIADIQTLLVYCENDELSLETLIKHRDELNRKIKQYSSIVKSINQIVQQEQEVRRIMKEANFEVEVKQIEDCMIAGKRYVGKYSECGKVFGELCRKTGWLANGAPFNLYYDDEFKEDGAQIECCIPIKKEKALAGLDVRTLNGGKALSLMYQGPYEEIGCAYQKIMGYAKEKGIEWNVPIREIYHKGPGMIFRGNPNNYLTEIQLMTVE